MRSIITKGCFERYVAVSAITLFTMKIGLEKLTVVSAETDAHRIVGVLTNNSRVSDAKFFHYESLDQAKAHVAEMLATVNEEDLKHE